MHNEALKPSSHQNISHNQETNRPTDECIQTHDQIHRHESD